MKLFSSKITYLSALNQQYVNLEYQKNLQLTELIHNAPLVVGNSK